MATQRLKNVRVLIPQDQADAYRMVDEDGNILWASTTTTTAFANTSLKRLRTTDGVLRGTRRTVGGRCTANVSTTDTLLASAGAGAFVDFATLYNIPASTLKLGSRLRIRGHVQVTDASGTDTLRVRLKFGGTAVMTSTAFDPSATTDFVMFEFEVTCRAAPGAAVSCTGQGSWQSTDATNPRGIASLQPTNFATNGGLPVRVAAIWSSTTALTACRLDDLVVFAA